MILATLGTHPAPMPRLQEWLQRHAVRTGERCVLQGAATEPASPVELIGIVSPAELADLMDQADVIITHGGPGSIMAAMARGKRPIVVPRDPRLGEHVDLHQVRFAEWLADRRPIRVVTDVEALPGAVDELRLAALHSDRKAVGPSDDVLEMLRTVIRAR